MSGPFGSSQWMYSSGFYGHEINQSVRLSITDGSFASITPSSAGDRQKFTFSTWLKRGRVDGTFQRFFCAEGDGGGESAGIRFDSSERLDFIFITDGSDSITGRLITNRVFRDTSSWYHIVVAQDTTQSTGGNRIRLYVNGVEETSFATDTNPTQNHNGQFGATVIHRIGAECHTGAQNFDGYMAETHYVDGQQLTPSSFGQTKNDIWIPKNYSGSYGTTGFKLTYSDTSSNNALVSDSSGNGNDLTANAIVAGHDFMKDSPTNNFSTLRIHGSPQQSGGSFSQGNLEFTSGTGGSARKLDAQCISTILIPNSGKWYCEVLPLVTTSTFIGVTAHQEGRIDHASTNTRYAYFYPAGDGGSNGQVYIRTGASESTPNYGAPTATGDVIGIFVDMDQSTPRLYFSKNGQWASGSNWNQSNPTDYVELGDSFFTTSSDTGQAAFTAARAGGTTNIGPVFNFGQDGGAFRGQKGAGTETDSNGNGLFKYAVPSGGLALCTANLDDTTISPAQSTQATNYFNTVLWSGNGSDGRSITGVGFDPDFVWIKGRNVATSHLLNDTIRGANKSLFTELDSPETADNGGGFLNAFVTDGFSVTSGGSGDNAVNDGSYNYVSWNWKAGGSSASSDSNGSITSSVSANTTAGFSIVTYTGNGAGSATVGHGLGVAPAMYWVKARTEPTGGVHFGTDQGNWIVYAKPLNAGGIDETDAILLNKTDDLVDSAGAWNDTAPTSTVFTIGTADDVNESGDTYVAYCFANVDGYCKVGSYDGNGDGDGPQIITGFRPAWLILKNIDTDGTNWWMFDNKRSISNVVNDGIIAQGADAEFSDNSNLQIDFLSNGFKLRTSSSSGYDNNTNGGTVIYMAFAEQPFKFANAR